MPKARMKIVKAGRRAVSHGATPRYRLDLERRRVEEFPWLEFDGSEPAAVIEAARRAVAAELKVRADQGEVGAAVGPSPPEARAPCRLGPGPCERPAGHSNPGPPSLTLRA